MSLVIQAGAVPLRVEPSGAVRVGSTRVLLDLVLFEFNNGATPEEIVFSYSTLELADVYAVIAYYLKHKAELDAYLRQREAEGDALQRKIEAAQGDMKALRKRILARKAQMARTP